MRRYNSKSSGKVRFFKLTAPILKNANRSAEACHSYDIAIGLATDESIKKFLSLEKAKIK